MITQAGIQSYSFKNIIIINKKVIYIWRMVQLVSTCPHVLWALSVACLCTLALGQSSLEIPLTYSFNPSNQHKYPVELSFNQSETSTPFRTDGIYLYGLNVSMETKYAPQQQSVIIGLEYPSSFLYAIQAIFKVEPHEIEFGKGDFLELLIKDNNLVESSDNFRNGDEYQMQVQYNFGEPIIVNSQKCFLIDGDDVYFDEFFILEVLNSMDPLNDISFSMDSASRTITLTGQLDNFPMISLLRGQSKFETSIKQSVLHYLPRGDNSDAVNLIGYMSLDKFGKFSIADENIVFKRTAQLFQLYLFFAYFFAFTLVFLVVFRAYLTDSMKFIKNVVAWVVFQRPEARIRVLRTELE